MAGIGFDPLAGEETEGLEACEEGVDGSFGDDEVGGGFEVAEDFEAIEFTVPEGGEDGEFEGAFAELDFPFIGGFGVWHLNRRTSYFEYAICEREG